MAMIDSFRLYELSVKGVADGQAIVNVFHYASASGGTVWGPDSTIQLLSAFRTDWRTFVIPALSESYSVVSYSLRELLSTIVNPTPPPPLRIPIGVQEGLPGTLLDQGQRVGDSCPTFVAVSYRKRASISTRRTRGSFRLGTVAEADTLLNQLSAAGEVVFDPATISGILSLEPGDPPGALMLMQIFSPTSLLERPAGSAPRGDAVEVLSIAKNNFLGSQVSRKRASGVAA